MANSVKLIPAPKLKEYVFTEKLGSGTYASVYKAYKKFGSREVIAVKCVLKSSLNSVSTENLLTEIDLLKTLKHDNIVQLKDFSWDDHYIYLIMEYCSAGDLSKFIRSKRVLPEHLAKRFLQQIALALQYMRSKHVSHMDLKPQNVLLSSIFNPQLKIADFGFAHYLFGDTDAEFLRGSPLYMAPEMVTSRQYNEKADLWSVGVIMYECIFGRAPFASKSLKELGEKIKDTKPIEMPFGVEISDNCRHLMNGLLQRDPEKRMSFDEFLDHPFIDLKHRPSDQALSTAVSLVKEAVKQDEKGDAPAAVLLYCQALEYFVPAIHYETDPKQKQHLRCRVREYMARAEELKLDMKPPVTPVTNEAVSHHDDTTSKQPERTLHYSLDAMSEQHPHLQAALRVLHSAQQKEEREDYKGALDQYELALESMLNIVHKEPDEHTKALLKSQISRWMYHAEAIKKYLRVKDLHTKDTSEAEEKDSESYLSNFKDSCSIQ